MIKTSVVRRVSVDDVRQIPHLTAVGMMITDICNKNNREFGLLELEEFQSMLNHYVINCDSEKRILKYTNSEDVTKKVIFHPAGLDGIKVVYHLNCSKVIVTYWTYDQYEELAVDADDLPEEEWD